MEWLLVIFGLAGVCACIPLVVLRPQVVFYIFLFFAVFSKVFAGYFAMVGNLGIPKSWGPVDVIFFLLLAVDGHAALDLAGQVDVFNHAQVGAQGHFLEDDADGGAHVADEVEVDVLDFGAAQVKASGHVVDVVVHPLVDFVGVVAQGLGQGFDGGGKSGPPAAAPAGACANATAPEPNRRGQMSRCRIYSQISLYRMWGKRRQLSIYELLA